MSRRTNDMNAAKSFEHGLAIIETETNILLHAVLYSNEPSQEDAYALVEEMSSDPGLRPIIEGKDFYVTPMVEDMVAWVKTQFPTLN